MTAGLALLASLFWGTSDFGGGRLAGRLPAPIVLAATQLVALAALVVAALVELAGRGLPVGRYLVFGALAGVLSPLALASYYRALAIGPMGLVAPVAAAGGVVPVLVGLLEGNRLDALQGAGVVLALAGAALCAVTRTSGPRTGRSGIALAIVAGIGFGAFYPLVAAGARHSIVGTLLVQRLVGVLLTAGFLAVTGRTAARLGWFGSRRLVADIVVVGLLDLSANVCFMVASRHGELAVAGTLGSLYPVATAGLAAGVLHERLSPAQLAGASVAIAGVLMLSAAGS